LNHQSLSNFIWSVAELLRGDYKQSEYGRVILPFTVLRRLDCALMPKNHRFIGHLSRQPLAQILEFEREPMCADEKDVDGAA